MSHSHLIIPCFALPLSGLIPTDLISQCLVSFCALPLVSPHCLCVYLFYVLSPLRPILHLYHTISCLVPLLAPHLPVPLLTLPLQPSSWPFPRWWYSFVIQRWLVIVLINYGWIVCMYCRLSTIGLHRTSHRCVN